MGNKLCKGQNKAEGLKSFSVKELENAIFVGDIHKVQQVLERMRVAGMDVNGRIIGNGKVFVGVLAFAFFVGNLKSFQYLYRTDEDFCAFNESLVELEIDPFYYMCEKGYADMLVYLLPIFTKFYESCSVVSCVESLTFGDSSQKAGRMKSTPIQRACEKGNISVVMAVRNYFKDKSFVPFIFDFEKGDWKKGENCALIACRIGNLALIRALHKICNVDFHKLNSCNENALIVCLSGYKKNKIRAFFECFVYLVDSVKVDLQYKYEELLLLAEGEFVEYVEERLTSVGICVKKSEIEEIYRINPYKGQESNEFVNVDNILKDIGSDPCETESQESSISYRSVYEKASFFSELELGSMLL